MRIEDLKRGCGRGSEGRRKKEAVEEIEGANRFIEKASNEDDGEENIGEDGCFRME